jgi:lysophospholipase L1-like esterase
LINTSEFWEREVLEIEERNEEKNNIDIVFYGSSSIRMWYTLSDDLSDYKLLNHGFGGSKLNDAIYFYDRLIKPYNPRLVVCYSGTNDIQSDEKHIHHARHVFKQFKKLYKKHLETCGSPMIYIAITPTPSRKSYMKQVFKANQLIKNYALKKDQLYILDVSREFLTDGEPNETLFVGDGLHLNNNGYEIWRKAITPLIDDLLK